MYRNHFINNVPDIIGESDLRSSAVGIVLTEEEDIIFEIRSEMLGHQPGDICLPGGSLEDGETPQRAVVREISEELRIVPEAINVIGPVSILVTGPLRIHSFLCEAEGYTGSFQKSEVSEILQVPLSFFLKTDPEIFEVEWKPVPEDQFPYQKIYGGRDYGWREHKTRIRFYEYEGHVIWGITARIMEDFVRRIKG